MKTGIICANETELAPFLEVLEETGASEKAMLCSHEGRICGKQAVLAASSMGKVNAALAAQILIDRYGVERIVNSGTAGGMHPEVQLFDVVISTEAVYHDVLPEVLIRHHPHMEKAVFPADREWVERAKRVMLKWRERRPDAGGQAGVRPAALSGQASADGGRRSSVHFGRMATGEAFIADEGREEINASFAPLTVDMETAAIAHVCHVNRVPWLAVRCVTDTADHSGAGAASENCPRASALARDAVCALMAGPEEA